MKALPLLLPLLLFIFALLLLQKTPAKNYMSPRPLNYKSNYESFYNPELPYVTVSVPNLYSTGLQYRVNDIPRGQYYYTLNEGLCQFYLLNETAEEKPSILTNQKLTGQLVQLDDAEYEQLLTFMADSLEWKKDSLKEITVPYAVSELPDPILFHQGTRILCFLSLLLSLHGLLHFVKAGIEKRQNTSK